MERIVKNVYMRSAIANAIRRKGDIKMIYRLFTENKNADVIQQEVLRHFSGFTVVAGGSVAGYWQGGSEYSMVIEIDTLGDDNKLAVYGIAEFIKKTNGQQAVLVQEIESKSKLV